VVPALTNYIFHPLTSERFLPCPMGGWTGKAILVANCKSHKVDGFYFCKAKVTQGYNNFIICLGLVGVK